jgi:uncharacterized RDD family membrane protein YckC
MSAFEPYPAAAAANESIVAPRPPGEAVLASRWRRFWALCVDTLILAGVAAAVGFTIGLLAGDAFSDEDSTRLNLAFSGLWLLLVALYYPWTMSRSGERNGQTLGKQMLNVRVVTTEGVPVTAGRALRRELLGVATLNLLTFGLYALIDCPWALFDGRRQALHDKIGSTYVLVADARIDGGQPPLTPPPSSVPPPSVPPPAPAAPPPAQAPVHDWQPPTAGDGNDAARRAFGA